MILVYKDDLGNWHLVKSLGKTGLASISIISHCGKGEGGESITQVPDNYMKRICKECSTIIENLA